MHQVGHLPELFVLRVSSITIDDAVITSVTSAQQLNSHFPRRTTNSGLNVTERRADKALVVGVNQPMKKPYVQDEV
jgi:hypothetical protein